VYRRDNIKNNGYCSKEAIELMKTEIANELGINLEEIGLKNSVLSETAKRLSKIGEEYIKK